jgi:hypothetical protein
MGRRGYVMTRPAKHGSCVTAWAQGSFYNFLTAKAGLEVSTDNDFAPEDADRWEIEIPQKLVGRGKKRKFVADYEAILKIAKRLRAHPNLIKDDDGVSGYGDSCAQLLEEGVQTAKDYEVTAITIDWW